jgi:hypothetical protein
MNAHASSVVQTSFSGAASLKVLDSMKRFGLIFAILPLLLGFVTSIFQGGSMWDEGSGTGVFIWFMLLTLPVGLLLVFIGLVMVVVRRCYGEGVTHAQHHGLVGMEVEDEHARILSRPNLF